jgi:hypothetical protein
MKRLITALAIGLGLAIPATTGAATVEQDTAPLVQQQIVSHWNTADGVHVVTALCKPSNAFSVTRSVIFSDRWNCMETDIYSRVFWISVHVNNSPGGALESVTATGCNAHYSHHRCPKGLPTEY